MRFSVSLSLALALAVICEAEVPRYVGKRSPFPRLRMGDLGNKESNQHAKRAEHMIPQNANTTKFAIDGSAIPEIDFDIGEAYAGLLPISEEADETSKLYFIFMPSSNANATDEITIWLNGGPGCSSLEGFLQEIGPALWQYGTFKPVKNLWSWVELTNVLWVDQPVGTGFSEGTQTANSTEAAAAQFLGFFKSFIDTFGLHNKKIYITGESYAGQYVPYFADAMLNKKDKTYYDLNSIMIYNPKISGDTLQGQIPVLDFVERWQPLLNLNVTFMASIRKRFKQCGYKSYFEDNFVFPPPNQTNDLSPVVPVDCDLWSEILNAILLTNPCFDIYQIAATCPLLWDVLGFPATSQYTPDGANIYFDRPDVKRAINAPMQDWSECVSGPLDEDFSPPSSWEVLPRVIERAERVIIGHGLLDMTILSKGTLMAIQNMTWNSARGFSQKPSDPFYVPYHKDSPLAQLAASGIMGTTHTERGLTYVEVALAGHMVPQFQPSAAYRHLEFLLGRISSLSEVSDFTTQPGNFGNGPN